MTSNTTTRSRTRKDGENQTSFAEDVEEEEGASGGGATGGEPPASMDNLNQTLQAFFRNQELRDEKREREQQAQELRLRNFQHQYGQIQQQIQLDRLERGSVVGNPPDGKTAPPHGDPRERQPSLAAGSLGAPENPRERQLSAAAGSQEALVDLGGRQLSTAAGSLEVPVDQGAATPASSNASAAPTPPTSWRGPEMQPYRKGEDLNIFWPLSECDGGRVCGPRTTGLCIWSLLTRQDSPVCLNSGQPEDIKLKCTFTV